MKRANLAVVFFCILSVLSLFQIYIDGKTETLYDSIDTADNSKYTVYIEIQEKTLYLLQDNRCIRKYTVASGMSGFPSPLGSWKIVEKSEWGEGFGGRWLGLDVPWGTYGIHGTTYEETIGSAASHGCIRMFNNDIKELYSIVPVGTEVVIVNGIFGPFGRGFDEIIPGDRGADVLAIQHRLRQLGYFAGTLDGIYEDDMKHAVHSFQRDNGLEVTNTINKKCWQAMGFSEFE